MNRKINQHIGISKRTSRHILYMLEIDTMYSSVIHYSCFILGGFNFSDKSSNNIMGDLQILQNKTAMVI